MDHTGVHGCTLAEALPKHLQHLDYNKLHNPSSWHPLLSPKRGHSILQATAGRACEIKPE